MRGDGDLDERPVVPQRVNHLGSGQRLFLRHASAEQGRVDVRQREHDRRDQHRQRDPPSVGLCVLPRDRDHRRGEDEAVDAFGRADARASEPAGASAPVEWSDRGSIVLEAPQIAGRSAEDLRGPTDILGFLLAIVGIWWTVTGFSSNGVFAERYSTESLQLRIHR